MRRGLGREPGVAAAAAAAAAASLRVGAPSFAGFAPRQLQQLRPQDGSELARPEVREIRLLR